MANNFNIIIPLKKNAGDSQLTGVASTTSIDRDGERMSDTALKMMVEDIKTVGVNLFGNHSHEWENTLGVIKNARLNSNNQVEVDITLDDATTNPKIPALLNKLKRGINLGLSVGGNVESTKEEYSKTLGRKVKILDKVKIYEISIVGIPSNADAYVSIPQAIAKSMSEKAKTDCSHCGGSGVNWEDKRKRQCHFCGGTGKDPKYTDIKPDMWNPNATEEEVRDVENWIKDEEKSCPVCFGKLEKKERLNIEAHRGHKVIYVNGLPSYCDTCGESIYVDDDDTEKSCPTCLYKANDKPWSVKGTFEGTVDTTSKSQAKALAESSANNIDNLELYVSEVQEGY